MREMSGTRGPRVTLADGERSDEWEMTTCTERYLFGRTAELLEDSKGAVWSRETGAVVVGPEHAPTINAEATMRSWLAFRQVGGLRAAARPSPRARVGQPPPMSYTGPVLLDGRLVRMTGFDTDELEAVIEDDGREMSVPRSSLRVPEAS